MQASIDVTGAPVVQNQINLYKLDFVTQRLKEQRVSFCGIVTHIRQHVRILSSALTSPFSLTRSKKPVNRILTSEMQVMGRLTHKLILRALMTRVRLRFSSDTQLEST